NWTNIANASFRRSAAVHTARSSSSLSVRDRSCSLAFCRPMPRTTGEVSDGEMPVYYARPANAQNPPVILVAIEIFGLHEYIKDVTRRLGKLGAFAIAPDYYFRKGVDLTKITEIPQLMPIVNSKPDAELLSDLDATVAWAKSQGGDTSRLG